MTRFLLTLSAFALAAPALAQGGAVAAALDAGTVGERADGYLGVAGSVGADVRAQVEQINIKRRAVYTQTAAARGVSVEEIAAATGCQTLRRVSPGRAYSLDGSSWRVRGPGDPAPSPANCPN